MENQHRQIKGYRDLTQAEIDLMNEIKQVASTVGVLVNKVEMLAPELTKETEVEDYKYAFHYQEAIRWTAEAKNDLQVGFMKLTRAVAKPESF